MRSCTSRTATFVCHFGSQNVPKGFDSQNCWNVWCAFCGRSAFHVVQGVNFKWILTAITCSWAALYSHCDRLWSGLGFNKTKKGTCSFTFLSTRSDHKICFALLKSASMCAHNLHTLSCSPILWQPNPTIKTWPVSCLLPALIALRLISV